jgi:hypothetical protein
MSVELLYTSAPKGLRQGSRGFCTVLSTVGTPVNLATRLESLSGYRHLFATDSAEADSNPVAYSHVKFTLAGQPTSVVSRVAAYGADYSGRTNKLAHHVVVNLSEAPSAGPAWLIQQPGFMRTRWDGRCGTPATGPIIPQADQAGTVCETWQRQTGDAGWGGVVADAFTKSNRAGKPTWIIYSIDQRDCLLTLLNESIALLPPNQRWNATFSTYAAALPPDIDCRVRCVVEGSEEARFAAARGQVIQLVPKPYSGAASDCVNRARGLSPSVPKRAPSVTVIPSAEAADQAETPPSTPPLPNSAAVAAAGMPDLPSRHTARWIALVLVSVVLMVVMTGALTYFVLQSRSNTPANPQDPRGPDATMNPGDSEQQVAAGNAETTVMVEKVSSDGDADSGQPQQGLLENVPESADPESGDSELQTFNLSQTPSNVSRPETVELRQESEQNKETKSEPVQNKLDPHLRIDRDQAQLELTLESMLRGKPEVLISADDERIQRIADKDCLWAPSDSESETKHAPISVVARQSVGWIDACQEPASADVRIHSIAGDKHENLEIYAAISKSDQRLFLRVRVIPGSSANRLAELSESMKTLVDELNREVSKINSKDPRKDLLQLRRVWKARHGENESWNRIKGVGEQLKICQSLISEFRQTAGSLSNQQQQQLDAYEQALKPIAQAHRAVSEAVQACFQETFNVDTGRELQLFAAADAQVDTKPLLVIPIKFSVNVTEPGRSR